MEAIKTLANVREGLAGSQQVGTAIRQIKTCLSGLDVSIDTENLDAIEADYQRMKDFMMRGFADPQQPELLMQLVRRLYRLTIDIDRDVAVKKDSVFSLAAAQAWKASLSPETVRRRLETFVQEQALQSLQAEGQGRELHLQHQREMNGLFCAILVSPAWSDGDADGFIELLLSPTIEINDRLLLVSAMTLAVLNFPDAPKWRVLLEVYRQADDEPLRQRSFVGWALSHYLFPQSIYPEIMDQLDSLSNRLEQVSGELMELQQQMIHCLNADADHQAIQRDIMPDLLKNSHLRITRFGIEETEDALEDILHPDAADEAVERVEAGMKRMMEMQRQGADIYFGGFSQMKRFPFFSTLSNWFQPFYLEHPQLSNDILGSNGNFLQALFRHGPFCDSDKYSFALALSQVLHRMPPQMKELLETGEPIGTASPGEDLQSATYVRRMYLQDLYRFFRLYPQRSSLRNPFEIHSSDKVSRVLFLLSFPSAFFQPVALSLGGFLLKKGYVSYAQQVVQALPADRREKDDALLLLGRIYLHLGQPDQAVSAFRQVLERDASNLQALRGLAKGTFVMGSYREASEAYFQLVEKHPTQMNYRLAYCVAMVEDGRAVDVKNELYRLHYDHPTDASVLRALAWALLRLGEPDKALPLCERLLEADAPLADDLLNGSYCLWALRQMDRAVDLLHRYQNTLAEGHTLSERLQADCAVLAELGISSSECQVMADVVTEKG